MRRSAVAHVDERTGLVRITLLAVVAFDRLVAVLRERRAQGCGVRRREQAVDERPLIRLGRERAVLDPGQVDHLVLLVTFAARAVALGDQALRSATLSAAA